MEPHPHTHPTRPVTCPLGASAPDAAAIAPITCAAWHWFGLQMHRPHDAPVEGQRAQPYLRPSMNGAAEQLGPWTPRTSWGTAQAGRWARGVPVAHWVVACGCISAPLAICGRAAGFRGAEASWLSGSNWLRCPGGSTNHTLNVSPARATAYRLCRVYRACACQLYRQGECPTTRHRGADGWHFLFIYS